MRLPQSTLLKSFSHSRTLDRPLSCTGCLQRIGLWPQHAFGHDNSSLHTSQHVLTHAVRSSRNQVTGRGWQTLSFPLGRHTRAQSTTASAATDHDEAAISQCQHVSPYRSRDGTREQTGINHDECESRHITLSEQPPSNLTQVRCLFHSACVTTAELLQPRELNQILKTFLAGPSRILPFMTCPSTDALLPTLTKDLDLWFWKTSHNGLAEYNSYLVKKEGAQYSGVVGFDIKDRAAPLTASVWDDLQTAIEARDSRTVNRFRDLHWKILLHVCGYDTEALPSLVVNYRDLDSETTADNTQVDPEMDGFVIHNDHYDVQVSANPATTGAVPQKEQFMEALVNYCQQIRAKASLRASSSLRFGDEIWAPAEFLQRAASVLEYGDVKFFAEQVSDFLGLSGLDFWRSEIHFEKRPDFKPSAIWLDRKPARTLGTMRACAQMKPRLEEAYKAGILLPHEYQMFARHWGEHVPLSNDPTAASPSQEREVTIAIPVGDEIVSQMLGTLRELRDIGFSQHDQDQLAEDELQNFEYDLLGPKKRNWLDNKLKQNRALRDKQALLSQTRSELLPLLNKDVASDIRNTIRANDVTIITAATGSGKTTQIPQILFDDYIENGNGSMCHIACTQPRRVSTISVAKRVAAERQQSLGHEVGYNVRFDNQSPRLQCGINYMTSGLLLRILETDCQWLLASFSHLVLDEVHTRDIDTDLLLTALKNLMGRPVDERPTMPKIVLMSATIDAEYFADYFKDIDAPIKVSSINVPGKSYPVTIQRLQGILPLLEQTRPQEVMHLMHNKLASAYIHSQLQAPSNIETSLQSDLLAPDAEPAVPDAEVLDDLYVPVRLIPLVIDHIISTSDSGDILVFLPGLSEIDDTDDLLATNNSLGHDFTNTDSYRIFKLHSALYETNFDVFQPVPPGCRRIVLATNIAETSLTLPDVKFVVDTGLSRQSFYEQSSQSGQLKLVWISKAEVTQRQGRVGRTQPGHYFALYSDEQYKSFDERPQPELTRTSLTQIVLRVQESPAFQTSSVPEFPIGDANVTHPGTVLLAAPSAPDQHKIVAAGQELRNLKAVTNKGQVTALGKVLSVIPTGPPAAKAILLGIVFRCLDPLIFFGAQLEDCPIMSNAASTGAVTALRKQLAAMSDDDRLADAKAFFAYDDARRSQDLVKVEDMKTGMFLRHDTYREISQTSRQIYETIRSMLGRVKGKNDSIAGQDDFPQYLFPQTPPLLNTNSSNQDLVKALALSTAGSRVAIWQRKDWSSSNHPRVLPSPRSVNHSSGKKGLRDQRLRRAPGDLLAYGVLRILPKDKFPWACATSCVSPLTGILFAESLRLVDDDVLVINDWARCRIKPTTDDPKRAAKIILEYRKALDRFLAMALRTISLRPHGLAKVRGGEMKPSDFNVFLGEEDHPYRKIFVNSVLKVLELDSKERAERVEMRRLEAEAAEAPPMPINEKNAFSSSGMPAWLTQNKIKPDTLFSHTKESRI